MKTFDSLLLSLTLCVCTALSGTASLRADSPAASEVVAERLSDHWLSSAQQICLPDQLILYHGVAAGSYSADGKDWVGDVRGEILVLRTATAAACPYLQLQPSEKLGSPDPTDLRFTLTHGKTAVFLNPVGTAEASDLSPAQVANWRKYLASSAP